MQSKELSRKELVKMIAVLREVLCVANLYVADKGYDFQHEIEKVLDKTTFDVSDEDK